MSTGASGTAGDLYRAAGAPHPYRPGVPDPGMRLACTTCGEPRTNHDRETR